MTSLTQCFCFTVVIASIFELRCFGAEADRAQTTLPLAPVYRVALAGGEEQLLTLTKIRIEKLGLPTNPPAFYAVVTNEWLAGLAPLFVVERENRTEIRRRPMRGQENFSEPLFFALPTGDEIDAAKLVGRWDCQATREGSKPSPSFQLTLDGEQVCGRFDQGTDYRFAFITGGTFRSNLLQLRIEYIQDNYLLIGRWRNGTLAGEWQQTNGSEKGRWTARRSDAILPSSKEAVPLYEWRHSATGARHYGLEGEPMDPIWQREPRPLCRVWRTK